VSEQNVELVRTALAPFLRTGEPRWDLLGEEIETHDHDIMDAGEYRGYAGFRRWLGDWAAAWSTFTVERAQEWIDAGEEVVVVFGVKATGRAGGVELERQDAIVCRVKDAEIARIDYYNSRGQALEAVGLEE
jgi:ketosteroid isomerase-like protein